MVAQIQFRAFQRARELLLLALLFPSATTAQKKVACPDGDHVIIDISQISIQYDASSFAGTLSTLSVLSGRLEVAPKKLQEAAVATQQWNEFLKGLVAGYNSCAITRQQYADGVKRIYPRLKEDATDLEEIRRAIAAGKKADTKRLQQLINSFYANLRQFAQTSGQEVILIQIESVSEQITNAKQEIVQQQKTDTSNLLQQQKTDTDLILEKLNEFKETNRKAPLATPAEVNKQVGELRKSLQAKADEAEAAYNTGYALLDAYRFQEAIPHLQQAVAAVRLPVFYLALARAYQGLPDLDKAENALRDGLALTDIDGPHEAQLATQLGMVLQTKGDLGGALKWSQQALAIDKKVFGPRDLSVAVDANNVGQILQDRGDLDSALEYSQQALEIANNVLGPDHPTVALYCNNVGAILQAQGNLDGALKYTRRALEIDEKFYGTDHPAVATVYNNVGQILQDKGDLAGALKYTRRALEITEKVYGPDGSSQRGDGRQQHRPDFTGHGRKSRLGLCPALHSKGARYRQRVSTDPTIPTWLAAQTTSARFSGQRGPGRRAHIHTAGSEDR